MSNIAIINDLHWGCRNDLQIFYHHFEKFYNDFIQYLIDKKIKKVAILGDVFDRRKFINFKTLNASKRILFDRLLENNIETYIIIGNHDMHFRETLTLSSPSLVLAEYNNIHIIDKPQTITLSGTTIDMVPWICKENEQDIMNFIRSSSSDLCFGHFELANFPMYKGIESPHGMDTNIFEKYELVCSGHYHTKSQRYNIVYTGSPYDMNWQDYNDPRGFHVFNTNTRKLKFIQNKHKLFYKYEYVEGMKIDDDVTNSFVRIIVNNKGDLYKFDKFLNDLYNKGCYEVKIVEDLSDISDGEIGEDIDLEDTLDVLCNYIDSLELNSVDPLKQFMKTLYNWKNSNGTGTVSNYNSVSVSGTYYIEAVNHEGV